MHEPLHGPAYSVHTKRLIIRCWDPKDAPLLQEVVLENLEHLRPWMEWIHDEPNTLEQRIERLRKFRAKFDLGDDFYYGIFNPEETKVLGAAGLHTHLGKDALEVGYWIDKDYINRGFATEASAALIKVAFEIQVVNRVEIHCDPENIRSASIPRKMGFRNEAILRRRKPFVGDTLRDEMIWTLFNDEYPDSPSFTAEIEAYDVMGRKIPP